MFTDRRDAGFQLAQRLNHYKNMKDVLLLALPRGGVVTGAEIARHLNVPIDIIIVRKIGSPAQPELAVGAVSETGTVVLNHSVISSYGIPEDYIKKEILRQKEEISQRVKLYRQGKGIRDLEGKTTILVDDGVATGATIKAAITTLRREGIKKLVVAIPVAPPDVADEIKGMEVDEFICIETPSYFMAVGNHYIDFSQVSDEKVVEILQGSIKRPQKLVYIPVDSVILEGVLDIPQGSKGVVIFAHGSGSSYHSPRNKFVAQVLRDACIGTLLFDLLTGEEDANYENRFNVVLLTRRLKEVTRWIRDLPDLRDLNNGYFGSSTGAAAALMAAADLGTLISAVVSRGGRPDLAEQALGNVKAPTLLIVGGYDYTVLRLNQEAYKMIKAEKELMIVPGATHLFEEPGALEKVALWAAEWFKRHL